MKDFNIPKVHAVTLLKFLLLEFKMSALRLNVDIIFRKIDWLEYN